MSLLPHPTGLGEPCVTIRRWQLFATGGNSIAAALLGVFEVYHQSRMRSAASQGADREHIDLLQHHTTDQLVDRINRIASEKTVRNAVKLLVEKGFISIHDNPSKAKGWDKTKYFLFHPEIAILAIQSYQKSVKSPSQPHPVNLPDRPVDLPLHPVDLPDRSGRLTDSSLYLREGFKEGFREEPEIFSDGKSEPNPPPVNPAQTATPIDQTTDRNHPSSAPPLLPPKPDRPWRSGSGSNSWDEPFVGSILKYLKTLQGGETKTRVDALTWISNREHPARDGHEILRARWDEFKAEADKPRPMTDEEHAIRCAKALARQQANQAFIRDWLATHPGKGQLFAMQAWDDLPDPEKIALYRKLYVPPTRPPKKL
jgi:hypothetical protein